MMIERAQVAFLDVFDPSFRANSDSVRQAQAANWYARGSIADYVVLRYREVSALLREPRLRQSAFQWLSANGISDGPLAEWWGSFLLNLEGDAHARIRRLVSKAFTPPAIEKLRPFMRATTARLIDPLSERDACDFIADFADPYPLEVISELLGIPQDRRDRFRGWANDLGLAFGMHVKAQRARIEAAVVALLDCVDELLAERRRAPGADLLSALLAAEESGDRLTSAELRMLVLSLVFAGNDTTRNQLGLAMYAFLQHSEQWSLLAAHPELATVAVEEILRVYPSTPGIGRTAVEDFEFGGVRLTRGITVYLLLAAANSDPAVFGDACDFDISAPERARVLTFGGGIHHCLGNWLARAEMQEALPLLAARLRTPELLAEPEWRTVGITGPVTLPIRFHAANAPL